MSVTLVQSKSKRPTCTIGEIICPECEYEIDTDDVDISHSVLCTKYSFGHGFDVCRCSDDAVTYDLRIFFHNYLHKFSSNYSYEIACKMTLEEKPDQRLFSCEETRLEKTMTFKKGYVSMIFDDGLHALSDAKLYFTIRRLNDRTSGMSIPALHYAISSLQHTDGKDCKVILQAKDGQIAVHKFVLSQHSDVFRAMLAHEMKEKQEGIINMSDFDTMVLRKMVDYLYTGLLDNVAEMVQELFKLAHQYQIQELCRRCEEYYICNVDFSNDSIVRLLELIDLYELKELKKHSEKFVQSYEKDLIKSADYQKYLCQSLSIDKAVNTLMLAKKYNVEYVKIRALECIQLNYYKMIDDEAFLKLFTLDPELMKEIYIFTCKGNN